MRISFAALLLCLYFTPALIAQEPVAPLKYWIQFTDKNGSPYSLSRPEEFLSPKALERRDKQQIQLANNDLPVNPGYVEQLTATGVKLLNRSKWFNAVTVQVDDTTTLAAVRALPFVKNTQKVARVKIKGNADQLMEDMMRMFEQAMAERVKKQEETKGLDAYYGYGQHQIKMLNGDKLHQLGYTGKGITIAVLDAGFLKVNEIAYFDSLRHSGRLLGTRDFVTGGIEVFEDNSHGMSALSVMTANIPGSYVGTAPDASFWLLRTEDADSEYLIEEDNWVTGAEFADSVGADIINSSLGYTRYDDTTTSYTHAQLNGNTARITIGADIAAGKGILVVSSAGNSGADKWKKIGVPADGDSVLSIGAVTPQRNYASFSSQGPTADKRIKPNVTALGQEIMLINSTGYASPSNGTSFSSPVVAGMAACLWQAHPKATAMQVFKAIEQSSDQYDNPDQYKGFGIPDFLKAHSILASITDQSSSRDSIVNVFPNPFIEGLTVEFYSVTDQEITVNVTNLKGKKIARETFRTYASVNNLLQLEKVKRLKGGMYIVTVNAGTNTFSRRVLKKD